jgi:hypothetical protein
LAGTRQPAGSWRRKTKPSAVRAGQEGSHRSCKPTPSAVRAGQEGSHRSCKPTPSAVRAGQEGSHRSCKLTPSAVPGGAGKRADGRCPHRPPAVWEAALSPVGAAPISAHCRPGVRRRQRPRQSADAPTRDWSGALGGGRQDAGAAAAACLVELLGAAARLPAARTRNRP